MLYYNRFNQNYFIISRPKTFVCSIYTTRSLIVDQFIVYHLRRALSYETQFCLMQIIKEQACFLVVMEKCDIWMEGRNYVGEMQDQLYVFDMRAVLMRLRGTRKSKMNYISEDF